MKSTTFIRALAFTGLLLAVGVVGEVLAIVVAPTAVYLTDRRPAAAVTLYNPSEQPEEVEVGAIFGYPVTTDSGTVELFTGSDTDDPRSAAGWIQALPRRLVVPPGERRIVRLLGRPPADAPDGEYWARLVFNARGQQLPVGGVADSTDISVGVNLQVRTIIATSFRKGPVRTGIAVEDFDPRIEGDSLVVWPTLVRQGNAAFIGRLQAQLVGSAGAVTRAWEGQVAVYEDYARRWAWDVSDLPAGDYTFQMRLSTERDDIPPAHRLPSPPVVRTAQVQRR